MEIRECCQSKSVNPPGFFISRILFHYPGCILIASLLLFGILPLALLYFFPISIDSNPEKGFDTRGTESAGARLAWAQLQPQLLQGSRIVVEVPTVINNSLLKSSSLILPNTNRIKRSWADDLIASFSSVACYDEPIPAMSYLSQFVLELSEYEQLYSKHFLDELCHMNTKIFPQLQSFDGITPYRNIWHVSNFFACLAPTSRLNCSYLTNDDIIKVRLSIETCLPHRKAIVNCRESCQRHHEMQLQTPSTCTFTCPANLGVPANCTGQMMFDLFYRILPFDIMARPFYVNSFLPVYTFAAYKMYGYDVSLQNYKNLQKALIQTTQKTDNLKLRGILMDVKRDLVLEAAINDSRFSFLAAICVLLLIAIYSMSISYSFAVIVQLSCSVISALAIYRAFNADFPLLNLIVFVLLISIGSDGAFLLLNGFPTAERLNEVTFYACMRHTAATMFLTQFSTIVPFFLNIFSSVIAFRSFGLFAGLTLITNYALLITFLPAFLLLQHRYVQPRLVRLLPSSLWFCFPTLESSNTPMTELNTNGAFTVRRSLRNKQFNEEILPQSRLEKLCQFVQCTFYEVLPAVLIQGRLVWVYALACVLLASGFVCLTQMRLPQYNPLQLFHSSNPHEFYDNNAEKLFNFVAPKIAVPLSLRLIWGIERVYSLRHFEPQNLSKLRSNLQFKLKTVKEIRALASELSRFRQLKFIQHKDMFWPERFLEWSTSSACNLPDSVCCNYENELFSESFLDYCIRLSTTHLPTHYNDTLLYHNTTFELIGYTALLPTLLKYTHRFGNLSNSFAQFDEAFLPTTTQKSSLQYFWYTTEWNLMSTWFDLQKAIIADCKQSVIISFLVVFVFAAVMLRWKSLCAMLIIVSIVITTAGTVVFIGWEIGVLEGVILVLVVGLSFDYTLHYGAALPRDGCAPHRIQSAIRRAFVPVLMAALSSIIAGAVMLFSQTHAFFQVAVFLVVSTSLSFTFATFFFLPLLYIFMPYNAHKSCKLCYNDAQLQMLQLKEFKDETRK